jgi:hypothetical protein
MSEATDTSRKAAIASIGAALMEASEHQLDAERAAVLATRVVDRVRSYGRDVFLELIASDEGDEQEGPNKPG